MPPCRSRSASAAPAASRSRSPATSPRPPSKPATCSRSSVPTPRRSQSLKVGGKLGVDLFKVGQKVDVQGVTIGKGFAGVIKRHHFSSNRATHGNSISHNKPGSTGQNQSPGRVFPGKRMAGHLGDVTRTVPNLVVVRVDTERQLLLVRGSVPGSKGRDVFVRPAAKA